MLKDVIRMRQPVVALFASGGYPEEKRLKIRSDYIGDGYKVLSMNNLHVPREKMQRMLEEAKHTDALVIGMMLYLASNADFVVYLGDWYHDYVMVSARMLMRALDIEVHEHD
jgi:hypothetical protein